MKKEIYKGTFGLTHQVWKGSYTAEIIVYYDEDNKEYEYDLKYDSSRERIWIEKDFLSLIRNVCDFIEYDFNFKNKTAFVFRLLYSFLTKNNNATVDYKKYNGEFKKELDKLGYEIKDGYIQKMM